jgi:hypothetical protein
VAGPPGVGSSKTQVHHGGPSHDNSEVVAYDSRRG